MIDLPAFWDEAHRRGSVVKLGATQASRYTDYFSQAGPFAADLAFARSVLDIGPGFGNYLKSLEHTHRSRYAIEVSKVNRDRLTEAGVNTYAPGQIGGIDVDLATCLSVVQHCPQEAFETILADAARALRHGGVFYLNGVCGGSGDNDALTTIARARCGYSPELAFELASRHFVVEQVVHGIGALRVWILRCVKP